DPLRPHIADDADNFRRRAAAGDQQRLADGIFVRKNFFCPCPANETNVPAFGEIMFIQITSGDERNSPGLEVSWHYVVTWRIRSIFHRRDIAVRPRVKRAISTSERNIAADGCALDAWRVA